jgi:signal transduction histidine kinase
LARALNSLCDQLREAQHKIDAEARARVAAMDQLRHADRLRTVGRLAAGLAHELGTPLNVVSGRAALISSGRLPDDEVHRSAVIIKSEADRIATIIRQLLDFARRNTPHRKPTDLVQLTRQTIQLLTPIAEKRQSHIDLQAPAHPLSLDLDSAQIQQVLTNLMVNAVESMPRGGPVQVTIDELAAAPPDQTPPRPTPCVRLAVCDKGQGIAPEIQEQIFEPFFTTKDVGEGTGLGLSIAYGIVQEHGGWIEVESQPGQGSCFSVYLPREPVACQTVS